MISLSWITAPIRALTKVWDVWREARTQEAYLLTIRDLTARELKRNAHVAAEGEREYSIVGGYDVARFEFGEWDRYKTEWGAFRRRHPALWHEVADAYEALRLAVTTDADPSNSEDLYDLAQRLQETEL